VLRRESRDFGCGMQVSGTDGTGAGCKRERRVTSQFMGSKVDRLEAET